MWTVPGAARKEGHGQQVLGRWQSCHQPGSPLLAAGILPRSWSHYTVPAGMTVIQWVSDFSERVKQLQSISQAAASGGAKELKVGEQDPEKSGAPVGPDLGGTVSSGMVCA